MTTIDLNERLASELRAFWTSEQMALAERYCAQENMTLAELNARLTSEPDCGLDRMGIPDSARTLDVITGITVALLSTARIRKGQR